MFFYSMNNHLKDILIALAKNKIKFVLCGGVAVVLHGVERLTMDIDVAVSMDEDNLYSDYMSTLGSVDLATLTATSRRFKHALTQKTAAFEAWRSKARYNAWMYGGTFGDIVKLFNDSPARWK